MTGIRVHWVFDEMYSSAFLVEADLNGNRKIEEEETLQTVKAVFIDGEKDLYPFMHIAPLGNKASFKLQHPQIWMENEYLNYKFDIVFDTPQPLAGQHQFGMYDPEFYVAFEQDLNIKLPTQVSCVQELAENESISIYMGLIHPETYKMSCNSAEAS